MLFDIWKYINNSSIAAKTGNANTKIDEIEKCHIYKSTEETKHEFYITMDNRFDGTDLVIAFNADSLFCKGKPFVELVGANNHK